MAALISERELAFLLYEFLDTEQLLTRPRYADQSRDAFDGVLQSALRLATDLFAPHNVKGDQQEPVFREGATRVIPEAKEAWKSFAESGFLLAHWDAAEGGLQLPEVILRAAMAQFFAANIATTGYPFLTIGAANLLRAFGSDELKQLYLPALGNGRAAGTMALTEPGQGSSLADIKTVAVAQPDGSYRLSGQKMFISGGDQDLTENIVHMVLARIQGSPAGVKGISLFLVPKHVACSDGTAGKQNEVALTGLLHKMGWRQTTSTVLSFGGQKGAVGYLVGVANQGLAHMFHMMNEARIGVGLIAASIAYRGFAEALLYARDRRQGRPPSIKDPASPQVRLVEHADIRRLLLTQKCYAEGALGLCLYASSLFEDQQTHPDNRKRASAKLLLDVLTPVVKSWSAKYGCVANEMAIQTLGGAGYTREYLLEQLYRDQRLNPIHEGTEGIHGIDLLGRRVTINEGAGWRAYSAAIAEDIESSRTHSQLHGLADAVQDSLSRLASITAALVAAQQVDLDLALANSTLYLDAFGRITAAWIWLKQAMAASRGLQSLSAGSDQHYYLGKLQAARYYIESELPIAAVQLELLAKPHRVAFDMKDEWFQ